MGAVDNILRQQAGVSAESAGDSTDLDRLLGRSTAPTSPSTKTVKPIQANNQTPRVGIKEVAAEVPGASKKVGGKVWNFIKSYIKPVASAPATAHRAGEGIATIIAYGGLKATGQDKKADQLLRDFNKKSKKANVPGLGEVDLIDRPLEAIGVGAQIGGYLAPGVGPSGSLIMKALAGGSQFGLISGGEALAEEKPTVGGVAGATAGGFATGALLGVVSKVLGKVFKKAPNLPGAVENAGYVAPDVKVKAGQSILAPNVLNNFKKQAAMQVEHEAPGMGKVLEKVNLKGVTNVPQAEKKLLAALPKNAPESARQAVRSWAKSEMGMIGQRQAILPAEAERAAAKAKPKPLVERETITGYRSVGNLGKSGTKEKGVMYFTPDEDAAKAYNQATGNKGIAKTHLSVQKGKMLDLTSGKSESEYLLKAQKQLGKNGLKMTEDARINWLARKEGYDVVNRGPENGMAILNPKNVEAPASKVAPAITKKAERFAERVKKAADTHPEVAEKLNQTYKPITNEKTFESARKAIQKDGIDASLSRAKNTPTPSAQSNAESQILIKQLMEKGRTDDAISLVEHVSKINRESGQAVQALAAYSRLTPEGMLRVAQKTVDDYHRQLAKSLKVPIEKLPKNRLVKLTRQFVEKVTERMKVIDTMPDGLAKSVEMAKVLRDIQRLTPSSFLQKLSTLQTIAQLSNPKTIIRNVVGNTGFSMMENIANVVRVPTDVAVSKLTGNRTASFAGFRKQFQSLPMEAKIGYLEAKHGIKLDDLTTQMDLPQKRTFQKGVMGFFERALDWGLRLPDRIGYGMASARKKAELESLVKMGKSKLKPEQISELSDFYGKYATFQDLSPAATGAKAVKKGLNFGQDFGVGDVVLKYPKTPANLLARAIDYSPTGFLKTIFEAMRPLAGKMVKRDLPFRQAEFVDSFSRALVGSTGLVGTGAALAKLGIITPERDKDKDVEAFRKLEGIGSYRFNVDGLWRYIKSGFDKDEAKLKPGDRLMSYDWFQPNAVMTSIGAHMASNKDPNRTVADTIVNSLAEGVSTIAEQPLVTGVKRLFGSSDPIAGLVDTAIQAPASFIPTFLNQINQLLDNKQREVYSNHWWQEMLYSMANRVPKLSGTVPARVDVLGREAERYQPGSNSVFNVMFNPAFMSVYQPTPMTKEILRLYEQTGEKGQVPSLVPKKVKINGTDRELTSTEYQQYQKFMGGWTTKLFIEEMQSPRWKAMSDTERVDWMQKTISNVRRAGKIKLFGDKPERVPSDVLDLTRRSVPETPLITGKREVSKESEGRKQNLVQALRDYSQALRTEPFKTTSAIFGPERLRKIENDAVILERQVDLGALDLGDKRSAVDHIVPLGMGGSNSWRNLQILSNDEKGKKDRVEKYLINQLQRGKIKRKEAQKRIIDWRKEYDDLEIRNIIK